MLDYIEGNIEFINIDHIVISTSGIGFKVFIANPFIFETNKSFRIYLYNQIREDEYSLYGFKDLDQRDLFLKLINVKGLGPKSAITILGGSTVEGIIDAIEKENILYLQKFPKIGQKLARQIILDLKGKLVSKEEAKEVNQELTDVLVSLGYKKPEINKIIKDIDPNLKIEEQVKQALKLLLR